ncbi:respiratory nitrate reductase subunit gamma [Klebsiella pneumoniae]|nr:respiratory nitrate reductase subunit gamma [Klebsiella pneumoniae]
MSHGFTASTWCSNDHLSDLPFTRLVHVWSAPVEYFTRRYQVVRSRR